MKIYCDASNKFGGRGMKGIKLLQVALNIYLTFYLNLKGYSFEKTKFQIG